MDRSKELRNYLIGAIGLTVYPLRNRYLNLY